MKSSMRFLILLLLFVGCVSNNLEDVPPDIENLTVYTDEQKPAAEIEFILETSFGDTEEVFFGRMVENFAVDHSGRVFIADQDENTIHIFNSDGSYLQNIGRSGQGPGEFEFIRDIEIYGGNIHVLDPLKFRITMFDLDSFEYNGEYGVSFDNRQDNQPEWLQRSREEKLFYRPTKLFVRPDGSYLILFYDEGVGALDNIDGRTYEVSIYDPGTDEFQHDILSFEYTGQILIFDDGNSRIVIPGMPYKRSSQFDYSNGQFVHGWSEEMLFRFYDKNGLYQNAFYHSHTNLNLTIDDVLKFYDGAGDQITDAIRSDDQPDTWPAFRSLTLDDENRLWVSTFTDGMDNYEWRLFSGEGRLIATFLWPRTRDLKVVKNGYAYTMERDLETGQQNVVKYKIDLKN